MGFWKTLFKGGGKAAEEGWKGGIKIFQGKKKPWDAADDIQRSMGRWAKKNKNSGLLDQLFKILSKGK